MDDRHGVTDPERVGSGRAAALIAVAVALAAIGTAWAAGLYEESRRDAARTGPSGSATTARHSVRIRPVETQPVVLIRTRDGHGETKTVVCATCHATRPGNATTRRAAELDEFHQGLTYAHGMLSCLSCHNEADYDSLKLADGTAIAFSEVMTLCAQCHGPQMRDYRHGAHGGMDGYWDLTRGGRTRLNCVHCHDPHAPQFPKMQPTFKPRDRFLTPSSHATSGEKGQPREQ